ncbi:2-dehydro-3-deoxygalactonokinase [Flavisphingomonas formosensis]|uniref:2-dehydro-3-deoxygalactonokinase n=1 Tax=Flavisphingomonas formosensis TaxID=861534 RepID=UPI0012FBFD6E|nr:2-dehydro-3-deoxygalactonokinase [Sphingomonas formosensis]
MSKAELLAVDWGTTNRRVYALAADGTVLATERDERGLLAVAPGTFAAEAAAIRTRFGTLPMLCAGMVGSAKGWAEAPYLACPASFDALARSLLWVEPGATAIVPGLSAAHGDVMRGEEVQLLGAVAAGLAPADALLCQPGTHCKWARMERGMVIDFTTCITGELFALLRSHSLLAPFLTGGVEDGPAFRAGVAEGLSGKLIAKLFGVRAAALLGRRSEADSAAFASGLLIGADVASQSLSTGATVHLLADPHLGCLYAAAIAEAGGRVVTLDSHAAFVAGITHIWRLADDRAS